MSFGSVVALRDGPLALVGKQVFDPLQLHRRRLMNNESDAMRCDAESRVMNDNQCLMCFFHPSVKNQETSSFFCVLLAGELRRRTKRIHRIVVLARHESWNENVRSHPLDKGLVCAVKYRIL